MVKYLGKTPRIGHGEALQKTNGRSPCDQADSLYKRPPNPTHTHTQPKYRMNLQIDISMFKDQMQGIEIASIQDVLIMHHYASQIAHRVELANTYASRAGFIEWIESSIKDGAKRAHAWTNEENMLAPIRVQTSEGSTHIADPHRAMNIRVQRWATMWTRGEHEIGLIKTLLQSIRKNTPQREAKHYEVETIRRLINKSPIWKQGGADSISIAFLRMAPDKALEELAELFQMMDALCLPPIQILCTIIALIPKPDNGERPIGILSFIYRIYARLHKIDIEEWETMTRTEWDTAIAGNSALQAALKRMLYDEKNLHRR